MATDVDPPNDNPGGDPPGTPGYFPPTGANTKIAAIISGTNITFTAEQIIASGGPWATFTIKVTPVNDYGSGTPQELEKTI